MSVLALPHLPARGRSPKRRSLTLVELVVTLAIMSVLMTGLASAVLIASHALPDDQSPANTVVESAGVAEQIVEELRSAIWFTERSARASTFTVPDRDSDGLPERVRYAWSGTAGDALTRQYNGGSVIDVLEGVYEFDLGYDLKTVAEEYPGAVLESAEKLLMSYDSSFNLSAADVHSDQWWAEYFKPTFAGDVVSWKVTRAWFVARRDDNNDYTTKVQLRLPAADKMPSDTVVDEVLMPQLSLPSSWVWVEKSFSNAAGLSPSEGLCLSFVTDDPQSAQLLYRASGVSLPNAGWIEGDPNWVSFVTDKALRFYVYGTEFTPGPPQTATRQYVTGVRIALQAGDDSAPRLVTAAQTLNAPELLSGWWEADFDADPRLDHNGDGNADWAVGMGTFDPGSLVNGVWHADSRLETFPDNDFVKLTTVAVRFRNTSVGGNGAVFRINADWSAGTCAPIEVFLQLQPDNTQTLTVYKRTGVFTSVRLVGVAALTSGFVRLRLLIDADLDTVSVTVNDVHRGTYPYSKFAPPGDKRYATIYPDGSNAEFDYVSVRVGE